MPGSSVTYSYHNFSVHCQKLKLLAVDLFSFYWKTPGYPSLNLFQLLKLDLGYRIVDCRLVYVRIDFRSTDVGMPQNLLYGCKRRVMIKQKGGSRMASCMEQNTGSK